ncbi:MAG TPA: hypothetical protein VNF47_10950 [Streptosporangiaceae bacterium]|nr:hypothetical protein [Streptosporangiaceae bacterium]
MTVLASSQSLLAQPGTVAFLVIFGMGVVLYFVFRSMSKHLRKVNQAARDEAEAAARMQVDPTALAAGSTAGVSSTSGSAGPATGVPAAGHERAD